MSDKKPTDVILPNDEASAQSDKFILFHYLDTCHSKNTKLRAQLARVRRGLLRVYFSCLVAYLAKGLRLFAVAFIFTVCFAGTVLLAAWFAVATDDLLDHELLGFEFHDKSCVLSATLSNNISWFDRHYQSCKKDLSEKVVIEDSRRGSIVFSSRNVMHLSTPVPDGNGDETNDYFPKHPLRIEVGIIAPDDALDLLQASAPYLLFLAALLLRLTGLSLALRQVQPNKWSLIIGATGYAIGIFTFAVFLDLKVLDVIREKAIEFPPVAVLTEQSVDRYKKSQYKLTEQDEQRLEKVIERLKPIVALASPPPNAVLVEGHTDGIWVKERTRISGIPAF